MENKWSSFFSLSTLINRFFLFHSCRSFCTHLTQYSLMLILPVVCESVVHKFWEFVMRKISIVAKSFIKIFWNHLHTYEEDIMVQAILYIRKILSRGSKSLVETRLSRKSRRFSRPRLLDIKSRLSRSLELGKVSTFSIEIHILTWY